MLTRSNNRSLSQMREIRIIPQYLINCPSSCLIQVGNTHVICSATISQFVPRFIRGSGQGWLTAEYSMLPSSSKSRIDREVSKGKPSGRTQEIQRLIGRSLRSCLNLHSIAEKQIMIDCDVINADGGTRTASITGSFVALSILVDYLLKKKIIYTNPILYNVAAISCGIKNDDVLIDLDYKEDSTADVDANFVMSSSDDGLIELQSSAEQKTFQYKQFEEMYKYSQKSIKELFKIQDEALK